MRTHPWLVIDLMTNENLGWYETETAALMAHKNSPVTIQYRPGRKKKVKK